ncbi:excalibur calcium-binding domain-containing protein [Alteromonas flava]|uniref:excalibur calcium-binding domain-containing protein n=1 Tax=Alteromonas flava TaxID=2048003 RepID=UPI000C295023|nr:excalibur calcium-binding domain-containing protein [Alteromonas flava]
MLKKFLILCIVAVAVITYSKSKQNAAKLQSPTPPKEAFIKPSPSSFSCDGRQYCSQMTSYEEAKFFLENCPNTKMDGDNDGIPCERQF